MRLLTLSGDGCQFKTLHFNRSGPSFIVAKQVNPEQSNKTKSYNGVGKSLLIAIIDFCLGASTSSPITVSLKQSLPSVNFHLTIEHDNQSYVISRHTSEPGKVSINQSTFTLKKFNEWMGEKCFDLPDKIEFLSYRSLLPFFLRPSKGSYLKETKPIARMNDYQVQLLNGFLFGLSVELAQKKKKMKEAINESKSMAKKITEDPILSRYFTGGQDSKLALADLKDKIQTLSKHLKNFTVAEDYYAIQHETNTIKNELEEQENERVLCQQQLNDINASLRIAPDITPELIENTYQSVKLNFPDTVKKELSAVNQFYQDMIKGRTERFLKQKTQLLDRVEKITQYSTRLKRELDKKLQYLDTHQAIDMYRSVTEELSEYKQQCEKLEQYEEMRQAYFHQKRELETKQLVQDQQTEDYLTNSLPMLDTIMHYFRELSKKFYPDAPAGITIDNNTGDNQLRYQIEAKIQSDTSDGIRSVKIFCYDMTHLMCGYHHRMDFIFHDSRLFSDIDEVHCNALFEQVQAHFPDEGGKQYIASINQHQLNSLSSDMQSMIEKHTICTLTDESDDGKLLGMTIELNYD